MTAPWFCLRNNWVALVLVLVTGCEWCRSYLAESDRCSAPVSVLRVPAEVSAQRTSAQSVASWASESATVVDVMTNGRPSSTGRSRDALAVDSGIETSVWAVSVGLP